MLFYEQALWSTVGLYNTQAEVSRSEFKEFVETLDIKNRLPGIQGIGYSVPVSKNEKSTHIDQIRSEGFPDFTIRPEGERSEYSSIVYLEPFDWRNQRAFGYDMWSNEMRRKAMTQAKRRGLAINSGMITLVQETDTDVQKGFLMYLPVYEKGTFPASPAEREQAFKGWVYSPFRAGDLMHGIINDDEFEYGIELFDGDQIKEEALLFDSDSIFNSPNTADRPQFQKTIKIELQGRTWALYVHTKPNLLATQEANLPILIGVFGTIIDVTLFLVIFSLHTLQKRTEKLTDQLALQKVELEEVNKELSQFAYVASHDLKEPIRTISNFAELIEEVYADKLEGEGKTFLSIIVQAASRMENLIQSILEYSQIGKIERKSSIIDGQNMVQEIENDLSLLIKENKVSLVYEDLPEFYADKEMMRQLFSNLISNAVKYRKEDSEPIVRIEAKEHPTEYEFSVLDNGIGIEKQYQERIFEIFKRLHDHTEYSGTGIGLSSCKKIVELHKGTISLESEFGKGSTFSFTIPKK